jgi:hypothetical protein
LALSAPKQVSLTNEKQEKFLKDPVKIDITPAKGGQSAIEQIAYQVPLAQNIWIEMPGSGPQSLPGMFSL